jgi:hypothetical protein
MMAKPLTPVHPWSGDNETHLPDKTDCLLNSKERQADLLSAKKSSGYFVLFP